MSIPRLRLYGLEWHRRKSDAVRKAMIEPLAPWLDIEFVSWDGRTPPPYPQAGERVAFFQLPPPLYDPLWRETSLTWIPMNDFVASETYQDPAWWQALPAAWQLLAFSSEIERLSAGRSGVMSCRYFSKPDPSPPPTLSSTRVLYYWNRVGLVGPTFLEHICRRLSIERLLFRPDLDPGIPAERRYELPEQLGETQVELVPFYDDPAAYRKHISAATMLLAPRPVEGIGLVMVDALSQGQLLLAAPYPTATDYITAEKNGILLPASAAAEDPIPRDERPWWIQRPGFVVSEMEAWAAPEPANLKGLAEQARKDAQRGYQLWQEALPELAEFLQVPVVQPSPRAKTSGPEDSLVSICVPHLNSMPFTQERIDSIRNQSWQHWECIVLDSGSDDGSLECWQQAAEQDPRIHIHTRPKEGIYPAFNESIRLAQGEYLMIATADDTMHEHSVERMLRGLQQHPECGVCHTPVRVIDDKGQSIKDPRFWNPALYHLLGANAFQTHIRKAPFDALCFCLYGGMYVSVTQLMFRRSALKDEELFPNHYGSIGDFFFHILFTTSNDVLYLPEALGTWRWHEQQASSHHGGTTHHMRLNQMIQDAYPKLKKEHPKPCQQLPTHAPGQLCRTRALREAVHPTPPYLGRIRALLRTLMEYPTLLSTLRQCRVGKDLSIGIQEIPAVKKWLHDADAYALIQSLPPERD